MEYGEWLVMISENSDVKERGDEKMAQMIELKNGEIIPVLGYHDALEIVQDKMGSEIVDFMKENINETLDNLKYLKDIAQKEKEEYEGTTESYACVLSEIRDIAEEMLNGFSDGKRPNRRELIKKLAYIKNISYSVL